MEKLNADTVISVKKGEEVLEFLTCLNSRYGLELDDEFEEFYDNIPDGLKDDNDLPENLLAIINSLRDLVITTMSKRYVVVKDECHQLQLEISNAYEVLSDELPDNYKPPFIFNLDQVINVFIHREYLLEYQRELRIYELLCSFRKQHESTKPTAKATILTLVPKDSQ